MFQYIMFVNVIFLHKWVQQATIIHLAFRFTKAKAAHGMKQDILMRISSANSITELEKRHKITFRVTWTKFDPSLPSILG